MKLCCECGKVPRMAARNRCRDCHNARQRRHYDKEENRSKRDARNAVNNAITAGKIVRPSQCEKCLKSTSVEAHHHDYEKPLDIIWLCNQCHMEEHY